MNDSQTDRPPTLDEQQLEALRPLAAVIESAIKDTPIRLGTDDWGTMLAAGILIRVAAYMGGVLPPVVEAGDWLMRGTRDVSIPEQASAADEDTQRTARRDPMSPLHLLGIGADTEDGQRDARRTALRLLLARLERGAMLADEKALLRHHVETEIREADTARRTAEQVDAVTAEAKRLMERRTTTLRRRAETAETELRVLRAGLRANGADPTQIQNLWAQIRLRNRQWRDAKRERDEAQAAIKRVREVTARRLADDECSEPERRGYHSALADVRRALDGTEQPTTEA